MIVRGLETKDVVSAVLVILLMLLVTPAVAEDVNISRSMPTSSYLGDDFTVTLSIVGLDAGGIIETLPDGLIFISTEHPAEQTDVSGQHVVFSVVGEDEIVYTVKPSGLGSKTIDGIWDDVTTLTSGTIAGSTVAVVSRGTGGSSDDGADVSGAGVTATPTATATSALSATGSACEQTFTVEGTAVRSLTLTGPSSLDESSFSVRTIDCPDCVPAVEYPAFRYLEMDLIDCSDEDISGATVRFMVDRSWVEDNSISEASIVLMRYHDGWTTLQTKRVRSGDTDTALMYEASVPGFSVFAISGRTLAVSESGTAGDGVKASATVSVPAADASVPQAETVGETGETESSGTALFGGIVLIIIIVGLLGGYWYLKKNETGDEVEK